MADIAQQALHTVHRQPLVGGRQAGHRVAAVPELHEAVVHDVPRHHAGMCSKETGALQQNLNADLLVKNLGIRVKKMQESTVTSPSRSTYESQDLDFVVSQSNNPSNFHKNCDIRKPQ